MTEASHPNRGHGLLPVWVELGRRIARGDEPTRLTLRELSVEQQSAIADALGMDRLPGPTMRIDVTRLQRALRAADLAELRSIAEAVIGPIVDQVQVRRHNADLRAQLWHDLAAGLAEVDWMPSTAAERFVHQQRSGGVNLAEVAARRATHERLLAVLRALPVRSSSRAVLSAHVLGDPHALDADTPLARLAATAIGLAHGLDQAGTAEADRAAWETVGVMSDQVSSTVLVLGLRAPAGHGLGGQLNAAADAGEPVVITLGQLRRWPLHALAAGEHVLVVENPSVVEWVARNGHSPTPLICSSGVPSVAVRTLLRQLGSDRATVRQHADFDPGGLLITRWLQANAGTVPWRMSARDYEQAIDAHGRRVQRIAIDDATLVPPTPWDPELQRAMEARRSAIFEEQLLPGLLVD